MADGKKVASFLEHLKGAVGDVLPGLVQRYAKEFIHGGVEKFFHEVQVNATKPDLYKVGSKKARIFWKKFLFGQNVVIAFGHWEAEPAKNETAKKVGA
jgi:hypothetical protein